MMLAFVSPKIVAAYEEAHRNLIQELLREAQQAQPVPPGNASEPLLNADELAVKLQVPRSWVYEQSRLGNIPTHRLGRYVRFRLGEVLESQKTRERLAGLN